MYCLPSERSEKKVNYLINFPAKNNQIILMNLFVCELLLPGPNLCSMNLSRISFMSAFMPFYAFIAKNKYWVICNDGCKYCYWPTWTKFWGLNFYWIPIKSRKFVGLLNFVIQLWFCEWNLIIFWQLLLTAWNTTTYKKTNATYGA